MNIAYIVTRADPIGGAQVHVRDMALAVREAGHQATVLTSGSGPFVEDLRAQGTPVILMEHLSMPIAPLRDYRAFREIQRVVAGLRPDLVAAHSSKAGTLARLAGRSLRIPVVFTAHGWAFTPGVPGSHAALYRRIERLVGPLASRIITVSEFDRRLALEARIAPPDRIVAVHNGIPDTDRALRADPTRSPPRLVMVARFMAQKDHRTLFQALAGLTDHPWELDLIGDGPLMDETRRLAAELGLTERMQFLGQRKDVGAILAASQVFLLISNWEGFPLSTLEAMRSGLPVIASAVGGVDEAVRDGETGFLVPRGDVDALRARLGRLLTDPGLRGQLGSQGRRRFESSFTLDHSVRQTLAVYRSALDG
jgi:glycosyltransferase involved in cell wall biosynthesis